MINENKLDKRKEAIYCLIIDMQSGVSLTKEQNDLLLSLSEEELKSNLKDVRDNDVLCSIDSMEEHTKALDKELFEACPGLDNSKAIEDIKNNNSDYIFPFVDAVPEEAKSFIEDSIANLIFDYSVNMGLSDTISADQALNNLKLNQHKTQMNNSIVKIKNLVEYNPNKNKIYKLLSEVEAETYQGIKKLQSDNNALLLSRKDRVIEVLEHKLKPYNIPKLSVLLKEFRKAL